MSLKGNGVIGIRREDKNRFERRVPLSPAQVRRLVDQGIRVLVQPSNIRCWTDDEYVEAGASIAEDLSPASTILAVKEVPAALLIPERTYLFFSHTIKAQPHNMPLLDSILAAKIRLIDYEKITDANNQRLVRFGPYAGYAGTIDLLAALGDRLLAKGYSTPFLYCSFARTYRSLDDARDAIRNVGKIIERIGISEALCPFVVGVTSRGSVAQAALEILQLLPHKFVSPTDLPALHASSVKDRRCVYICIAEAEHMVERKDNPTAPFDKKHYYATPSAYEPIFHDRVLPYFSVLVNCMYWDPRFPRLVTTRQAQDLMRADRLKLWAIADISCDPQGSVEFFVHATTIDDPTYVYDVMHQRETKDITHDGILFLGVDHLPAELPFQASEFFGESLFPFIAAIAKSDASLPYEQQANELPAPVYKAVMTSHGSLTPPFQYIAELRKSTMRAVRRVLVLGSGFVSAGLVNYFGSLSRNQLTIASNMLDQASELCAEFAPHTAKAVYLDLKDAAGTRQLISKHDVVVSLLPATLHHIVAEMCIAEKRDLVTTSYVSPEVAALDAAAKNAGITIAMELGLDPGIDHCSAKKIIDEVHAAGGQMLSFTSFAGGLPAPEFSNNPLGYKFSWNPRGVLTAAEAPARFLMNGKIVERAAGETYVYACPQRQYRGFNLEGVANRDSLKYKDLYGVPEAHTMLRGTLRFPGFATMVLSFRALGLMSTQPRALPQTWRELLCELMSVSMQDAATTVERNLAAAIEKKLTEFFAGRMDRVSEALSGLKWFGLLRAETKLDSTQASIIDALSVILTKHMAFEKGERDLVILTHEFVYTLPDVAHKQKRTSSLIMYGDAQGSRKALSAMAKTVGVPCAIATQMVLEGKLQRKGVVTPLTPDVYEPLLENLAEHGIQMMETVEDIYE
jgi:alpha-aminoadipic semialdehyde synthase